MIKKIIKGIFRLIGYRIINSKIESKINNPNFKNRLINNFLSSGARPWSNGYDEYKWQLIGKGVNNKSLLHQLKKGQFFIGYGKGVDERVIEYPWIFSNMQKGITKFLDAGSTFNFRIILDHPLLKGKEIYVYTYFPENNNFSNDRISYIYGDLRKMPFKDDYFDEIVCQSTIEHIDMDNTMYGYDLAHQKKETKSYEFLYAIKELIRVLKPGAKLLLTFPYGKFENHIFFQQFDSEMVNLMTEELSVKGSYNLTYFKYLENGWKFSNESECSEMFSYNPHTGKGKGEDGAAHSRSICCVKFVKTGISI